MSTPQRPCSAVQRPAEERGRTSSERIIKARNSNPQPYYRGTFEWRRLRSKPGLCERGVDLALALIPWLVLSVLIVLGSWAVWELIWRAL